MLSNRLAFAGLAVACIGAAAGGGYLATRQAVPASASAEQFRTEPVAAVTASAPVSPAPLTAIPPSDPVAAPPTPRRTAVERPRSQPRARTEATAPAAARETRDVESTSDGAFEAPDVPSAPVSDAPSEVPEEPAPAAVTTAFDSPSASEPEPQRLVGRETLDELVVAADSVVGLQLETGLTSERARVEDAIEARVVRDVRVGRQVAIPEGSRALGSVMLVERGGRMRDRARLGIRFHTLVLVDGTRLPISTGMIYRYGDGPSDRSARKIGGGAVAGAILGAIVGGARGAAVGATAGAGGGAAMVMASERSAAEFPSGTEVTARILDPVTVVVDPR